MIDHAAFGCCVRGGLTGVMGYREEFRMAGVVRHGFTVREMSPKEEAVSDVAVG